LVVAGILFFFFLITSFWLLEVGGGGKGGRILTWDIVNIATIHEEVAVLGVAERRQIRGIGGTGSNIAPNTAWQNEDGE